MDQPRKHALLQNPLVIASLAAFSMLLLAGCGSGGLVDRMANFWSYGLCSAIVVILDVVALLEVHRSDRKSGDKILWTLIIIFFPILGCIAYYFFGRK